jgi:hypothetical protein
MEHLFCESYDRITPAEARIIRQTMDQLRVHMKANWPKEMGDYRVQMSAGARDDKAGACLFVHVDSMDFCNDLLQVFAQQHPIECPIYIRKSGRVGVLLSKSANEQCAVS